jgi:hypothetical protein
MKIPPFVKAAALNFIGRRLPQVILNTAAATAETVLYAVAATWTWSTINILTFSRMKSANTKGINDRRFFSRPAF